MLVLEMNCKTFDKACQNFPGLWFKMCCNHAWSLRIIGGSPEKPCARTPAFSARMGPCPCHWGHVHGVTSGGWGDVGSGRSPSSCLSPLPPDTSVFLTHGLSQPKHFVSLITFYNVILILVESAWLSGTAAALGKAKRSWELGGHDLPSCPECQPEPGVFVITGRRAPVPGYLILWGCVRRWGRQGKRLYFRAWRQIRNTSGRTEGWAMKLWVLDGAVNERGARKPS